MTFAENLRRLRTQHFWSQVELGKRAGVHPLTITRLETGAASPSMRTVRALAEALGVAPSELANPSEAAEQKKAAA